MNEETTAKLKDLRRLAIALNNAAVLEDTDAAIAVCEEIDLLAQAIALNGQSHHDDMQSIQALQDRAGESYDYESRS